MDANTRIDDLKDRFSSGCKSQKAFASIQKYMRTAANCLFLPAHVLSNSFYPSIYYSAKDVRAGALDGDSETDEGDISTESNDDSEPGFDDSDSDDFDPILLGDYDAADDNMDID